MPAPPRITRGAAPRDEADPAEVVMLRRPAPDRPTRRLEPRERVLVDPGLRVDELPRPDGSAVSPTASVAPSPSSSTDAATPTSAVRSRVPPAEPIASASPSSSKARLGAIMLSILARRNERHVVEVDLAEHAVQVQVVAREEVARAEAEARRQDAGVAVGVDDGQVRRVPVRRRRPLERGEQREHALGLGEPREPWQPVERRGHARKARRG